MPERHYREYAAYYREQPFGLWRDDFRFAYLLTVIASMFGVKGQTPSDFMPFYRPDEESNALQQAIDEVFPDAVIVQARLKTV